MYLSPEMRSIFTLNGGILYQAEVSLFCSASVCVTEDTCVGEVENGFADRAAPKMTAGSVITSHVHQNLCLI
jgi:hypothetical protein